MLIVAWETTAACNLSCRYCRACATPSPDPDELSLAEVVLKPGCLRQSEEVVGASDRAEFWRAVVTQPDEVVTDDSFVQLPLIDRQPEVGPLTCVRGGHAQVVEGVELGKIFCTAQVVE